MSKRKRKRGGRPRPQRPAPQSVEPQNVEIFPYTLPDGRQALYVGEALRESDPPAVREGIARRRILATQGRCPCGAIDPTHIAPGLALRTIAHAGDCPAAESNLIAELRKAGR